MFGHSLYGTNMLSPGLRSIVNSSAESIPDVGALRWNDSGAFVWSDDDYIVPSLDLNFALFKDLRPRIGPTPSYTRASTGTYFNSSGVLTTAAINGPRFDHVYSGSSWVSKGLLIEEQRVNYVKYANDLSTNWANEAGATREYNSIVSPDGTTDATKLNVTVNGLSGIYQHSLLNGGSGTYTYSIFAKKGTKDWLIILNAAGSGSSSTFFNISNGTIGTVFSGYSATIVNVGNGWYRCTLTTASSTTPSFFQISLSDANNTITPASTGHSYVYGAQIELGSFGTSFIPNNTASSVTRSADVCQITGGDFSGFWNNSEGSIAIEYDNLFTSSSGSFFAYIYEADGGNSQNGVLVYLQTAANQQSFHVESSSASSNLNHPTIPATGIASKIASAYKINDLASSMNGATIVTDSSQLIPTLSRLSIGGSAVGGPLINGHIARLRYFNTRLTNSQLQVLST